MLANQNTRTIVIDKAIVHILGSQLVISKACLSKTSSGGTYTSSIIKNHIERTLKKNDLIEVKFKTNPSSEIKDLSMNIFRGNISFIDGSKLITQKLFSILANNSNLSKCILAICLFHNTGSQKKKLAILKIELSHGLQLNTTGPIIVIPGTSPFTLGTLQKIAVIQEYNIQNSFDVQLDDLQAGPTSKYGAAEYFLVDFLECILKLSNQYLTRLLYENMIEIENDFRKERKYRYAKKTTGILPLICKCRTRRFNMDVLNGWMNTLRFSKKLKIATINRINPILGNRTFYIHKTTMREYCERVKYHNSKELLIEVEGNKSNNVRLLRRRLRWIDNKIFLVPSLVKIKTDQWVRMKY